MTRAKQVLEEAKRIRSLAQIGLIYSSDNYDIERYKELFKISDSLTELVTDVSIKQLHGFYKIEDDYITPKVDVRAAIFNNENEILLVKEKSDEKWSLPGGWADIGHTPSQSLITEVFEETGLNVDSFRLTAIIDKRLHDYPPALNYVYKMFFICTTSGIERVSTFDILDVKYFELNQLPILSEERVIKKHIELMFDYYNNPSK